jgi:hypothetical protein
MPKVFKRSPLTERLVKYLSSFEKGTQISYDELTRVTGQTINSRTANLAYARRLLENEHLQVWVAVRNEGIKRCTDKEIAERLPNWHLRTAGRKLKRGGNQSRVVDLKQLAIDEQNLFGVHCLQQQLASQALSKQTHNRLAKASRGTSNDLPQYNILEWALPLTPRKR